jgi:protein phosphatase
MRAKAAGVSDVGLQREHNEDSFAVVPQHELFIVADGMGGHRAGDVASRLASESITDFFHRTDSDDVTWPFQLEADLSEEENRLLTAIRLANRQIYEHSVRSRELRGMGTTVVGALFSPKKKKMFVGHVGDSRAYRVRRG